MAYPVTLNGRTYTLADFEGTNYVEGLPDAFQDFVTHAGDIYNSTSTTSNSIGTGSKTFTVESAKPYQAGTPLRIADAAAPSTNFMDTIVTSYSGTTLVVDSVGYAGSGTFTSWNVNIGGAASVAGTVAIAQGGTGATTAAAARTNLDVYSKADADSRFLNVSGEASNVTMTGDVTIGDAASDTLTVAATAAFDTDTLYVDATNDRVGIGTTAPVEGKLVVRNDSGDSKINIKVNSFAGTNGIAALDFSTGGQGSNDPQARIHAIGQNNYSADLVFSTQLSGTTNPLSERMRIDSSGNVGIGTSSPDKLLHLSASSGATIRLESTTTGAVAGDIFGAIEFETQDTNSAGIKAKIDAYSEGVVGNAALRFFTGDTTSLDEAMRIDSGGRVLIGRTSSSLGGGNGATLQIGSGSNAAGMTIHSNTTSTGDIQFADGTSGDASYRGLVRYDHSADFMSFWSSAVERMRIDSSGNLLVGKTAADNTTAGGSIFAGVSSFVNDGARALTLVRNTSDGDIVEFRKGGSTVGSISVTGSSTSYNTSSDHRLKENVTDVTDGITRVKQLEPKRFNFIADPDTTVDGFLAHEAQAVVPEAITGTHNEVDTDGNPVYQGIDQSKLVPLLTAALKEAITKIETLETEMTSVKARLDALEGV